MRALKAILRAIQDRREEGFSRRKGLIPFGEEGLIALEPAVYPGPQVTLRSGLVIPHGSRIVDLHLNSRRTAEYYRYAPVKARLRLFRDAEASLRRAAAWLQLDVLGKEVWALRGVTLLPGQMERLGFEVLPLPAWPYVFTGIHMRWLSYLYGDEGRAERPHSEGLLKSLTPRQAWMSREEFVARYLVK